MHVNTTSAFVAAQQAVSGFEKLDDAASKTFIYTGNILNTGPMATLLDLGVGKSATAHIIHLASDVYKDRGFKYVQCDRVSVLETQMWRQADWKLGSTTSMNERRMGRQHSLLTAKRTQRFSYS